MDASPSAVDTRIGVTLQAMPSHLSSACAVPSCPRSFRPQQNARRRLSAHVWPKPAETVSNRTLVSTRTGRRLHGNPSHSFATSRWASSPVRFSPQQYASPAAVIAHVWFAPALIVVNDCDVATGTALATVAATDVT